MDIPIIPASQVKKIPPTGKGAPMPVISGAGVKEFVTRTKRAPTGVKPIIPTGDTCCTNVCKVINSRVKYMEDELLLREAELESVTEGLLLETREVTKKVPGKMKGQVKETTGKIEQRISVTYSQSRLKLKKQVHALTNQLSALKDIRYEMLDKGSCKCIETVKFPEREMMLEKAISEKEVKQLKLS